jgi:hypothetical protein
VPNLILITNKKIGFLSLLLLHLIPKPLPGFTLQGVPDMHKHFATSDQSLESFSVSLEYALSSLTVSYNSQAFTINMYDK